MKGLITVLAVLVVVGLAYFLYGSPTAPSEMSEADIAQIEAEVREWGEAWADGWEPEDRCEILHALFHPDHVVFFSGGEPLGRDGWFEYCESAYANWATFSGSWTDTDVRVISPDAAVLITRYDVTWEYVDGTIDHRPAGAHMILVERTSDGWGATVWRNFSGPRAEG